jgi:uncharacterized protein (DUF1499 family)
MIKHSSRVGLGILLLAVFGALAVTVMMFGARFGFWEPIFGFGLYRRYLNPIGYGVTGLGTVAFVFHLLRREKAGAVIAGIATLIGVGMLMPLILNTINPPRRAPPIHDITTNTGNPPEFVVLDDTRPGARNPLQYGGAETAALQAKAYPEIAPIRTDLPAAKAFDRAVAVARTMGWEIVASDPDALRFEATARTPVFYFADDVVLVVTPEGSASRIDLRSVSRVGRGDQGVNAARIRAFRQAFAG